MFLTESCPDDVPLDIGRNVSGMQFKSENLSKIDDYYYYWRKLIL